MTDSRAAGNPLWTAYEYVAMVIGLGSLAVICLGWLPFALLFNPLLSRQTGQRWGRYMIMDGFQTYLNVLTRFCACRFELSELDQLRNEGALILAANHPSLLDAVMITSRLPNAVCVMKAVLMDNILFGAAARLARYIRNNAPLEMILSAREELRGGAHLVIFPEGTRTGNFPIDVCTPSTALIAGRTGVPIQTLLIEYSVPYLGKAWPLWKRPQLPLHCRIRLGRRFPPPENIASFTCELNDYFRQELGSKSAPTTVIAA